MAAGVQSLGLLRELCRLVGPPQNGNVAAEDLLRAVAEKAFGPAVLTRDMTVAGPAENGFARGFDDRRQPSLASLRSED